MLRVKLELQKASVSIAGDYYQVVFTEGLSSDAADEPYFMVQRQLEFPDGGECTFESHLVELIDCCRVREASLSRNELRISYGSDQLRDVHVVFSRSDPDLESLALTLKEMIPKLTIE